MRLFDGKAKGKGKAKKEEQQEEKEESNSGVDAIVTLLATVVFGLGWTLVELERADPAGNRYDAAASEMWIAAVVTSIDARADEATEIVSMQRDEWKYEDTRWTEQAQRRSNR